MPLKFVQARNMPRSSAPCVAQNLAEQVALVRIAQDADCEARVFFAVVLVSLEHADEAVGAGELPRCKRRRGPSISSTGRKPTQTEIL